MIKGLYETHLVVKNLERAADFYRNVLSLRQCHYDARRRVLFFWIGKPREAMLGLWEGRRKKFEKRHFAFRCEADFLLGKATNFLKRHNIKPYNFFDDGTEQPLVFAWMPAVSLYFDDPDGNQLEFIAILEGRAKPELGIISYEAWLSTCLNEEKK